MNQTPQNQLTNYQQTDFNTSNNLNQPGFGQPQAHSFAANPPNQNFPQFNNKTTTNQANLLEQHNLRATKKEILRKEINQAERGEPDTKVSLKVTSNRLRSIGCTYDEAKSDKHKTLLMEYFLNTPEFRHVFKTDRLEEVTKQASKYYNLYATTWLTSTFFMYGLSTYYRKTSFLVGLTQNRDLLNTLVKYFLFPSTVCSVLMTGNSSQLQKRILGVANSYDYDQVGMRILYNLEIFARANKGLVASDWSKRVEIERRFEEKYPDFELWREIIEESLSDNRMNV